jgi:mRNA-degrading endonuclease toxin of MazEF toxin-antitoxin module
MAITRGEVWWGPAAHKSSPAYRPWLVVSNTSHPISDEECIVVAMTTQNHPDGIAVSEKAWVQGGSERDAYVSPWYVTTIKQRNLDNQQGKLTDSLVAGVVETLHGYIPR